MEERRDTASRRYQRKPRIGDNDAEFRHQLQVKSSTKYSKYSDTFVIQKEIGEIRREKARDDRYHKQGIDDAKSYAGGLERKKHREERRNILNMKDTVLKCALCGNTNYLPTERRTIFCGRCGQVCQK
jgi:hypothetical protein